MKSPAIKKAFIYILSEPHTGQVRYVGKTFDLKCRFSQHLHRARKGVVTHVYCWIRSVLKSGEQPIMEVLEEFDEAQVQEWEQAERFWIETLRFYGCKLTNLDSGGGSGRRASLSTRLKIGAHSSKRVHTAETRAKIGVSCKAKMTDAAREHLRQVNLASGFKHTEETKQRIAASKAGKKRPVHVNAALQAGRLAWLEERRKQKLSQPT